MKKRYRQISNKKDLSGKNILVKRDNIIGKERRKILCKFYNLCIEIKIKQNKRQRNREKKGIPVTLHVVLFY